MAADAAATFVSHNAKDFRLLHDAWLRWSAAWGVARSHGGILIVPQGVSAPILGAAISSLLAAVPSVVDACYVWHSTNGWRQHLVRP